MGLCGSLNGLYPHGSIYMNIWSPAGDVVYGAMEPLEGTTLLEEICQ